MLLAAGRCRVWERGGEVRSVFGRPAEAREGRNALYTTVQ